MCGRFTQQYTWRELQELYALVGAARNLKPRYNIAPTTDIDVVVNSRDGRVLVPVRWGLIPAWWNKTVKELPASFNARAETVVSKPMFRDAFAHHRCIVPASGYYEWKPTDAGRMPYYISAADGGVLSFAGVWDRWKNRATGEPVNSCTIIVTDANGLTRPIHHRMPAVLEPGDIDAWMSGRGGVELLRPATDAMLRMWPVSTRVNRATPEGDEDATLIEQVGA